MARKPTRRIKKKPVSVVPLQGSRKSAVNIGTLITLVLFAALATYTYYLNNYAEPSTVDATPTSETRYLFDRDGGQISSIEIKSAAGESVKMKRSSDNSWSMEQPAGAEADQGAVEAAATQVAALKIVDELDGDPADFGLDSPGYIISIVFKESGLHTLEIGDTTPTNNGYYIRLDDGGIFNVDLGGIDSLTNLVTFPPILTTPTPTLDISLTPQEEITATPVP